MKVHASGLPEGNRKIRVIKISCHYLHSHQTFCPSLPSFLRVLFRFLHQAHKIGHSTRVYLKVLPLLTSRLDLSSKAAAYHVEMDLVPSGRRLMIYDDCRQLTIYPTTIPTVEVRLD